LTASQETKGRRSATRGIESPNIDLCARNARAAGWVGVLFAAGLLASCGRGGDWRTQPAPADEQAQAQTGYTPPPRITSTRRLDDGQIELGGLADPNVRIRLASPDGKAYGAVTDGRGLFSLTAPAAPGVRLFGLSEDVAGRIIQGEGYLAVLPAPGRVAVLLRGGGGAHAPGASSDAPQVAAVDFDAGGGAVVSGVAHPGSTLRLVLDGRPAGEARADGQGGFSFALAAMLKPGDHELTIQSPVGEADARFGVSPSGPISGLPFRGQRQAGDWRIDWLTPAGGQQTTLIMD
jgi:hypothetical protein